MRFAVAVGLLAQTLSIASEPTNRALAVGQLKHSTPLNLRRNGNPGKTLRRLVHLTKQEQKQIRCTPKSETEIVEADAGILDACPDGLYCGEVGYCVTDHAFSRTLQEEEYGDYYDTFCTGDVYVPYFATGVSCDCSDFDVGNSTGIIACEIYKECDGNVCYDLYAGFQFDGSSEEYLYQAYCLDFTVPYEQGICYYYEYDVDECDIRIGEDFCSACLSVPDDVLGECTVFDCTNLANGLDGNSCTGERVSSIFDGPKLTLEVDERVRFLQTVLIGIESLPFDDQVEWAALTEEFIVNYWQTNAPDLIQDLDLVINILTVVRGGTLRRSLQSGGFVTVAYNIALNYLTDEENPISPKDVVTLPFASDLDLEAYLAFLTSNGTGDISMLSGVDFLGIRGRPEKSKKSGKKSKSSKSSKKGKGKGSYAYHPPPLDYILEGDDFFPEKNSKKSKKSKRRQV